MLTAAPAAQAAVVDVNYQCKTPIGDKSAVSPIDIKSVKSGSAYKLTMSWQKGVSSSPVELGKGAMTPSAVIKVGGADSGTVAVSGAANAAAIPANTPIKINDLSGTYTPKKSGKVTFTAGVLTIKALGTTTTCTPSNNPGPSLTLDVTAAAWFRLLDLGLLRLRFQRVPERLRLRRIPPADRPRGLRDRSRHPRRNGPAHAARQACCG